MDGNFSEKLNKILSDPQSMRQIAALAQTLGAEEAVPTESQSVPASEPTQNGASDIANLLKALENSPAGKAFFDGTAERLCLLKALKPYLDEPKREKLSRVISAMESVNALNSITKLL